MVLASQISNMAEAIPVYKWVLSASATSTLSKRAFLVASRTLDERWLQIRRETVDRLLFLHGLPVKA